MDSNPETDRQGEDATIHAEENSIPVQTIPSKFVKEENSNNNWMRSLISLALYLLIGFYIFPSYKTLLLITAIVMIHELGHFFAMKYFRYADLSIFFIPLLGAYVSGTKREVSQKESAIILLAGPLPGILIGVFFFFLHQNTPYPNAFFWGIPFENISTWFILLNLFNLLPVYPLDGGQLLNRVFLDEESWVGKIFVFISAAALVWFAWRLYDQTGHPVYFIFLIFPLSMILRLSGDARLRSVEKKIEAAGIDMDKSYEDLPDEDYWKVRNILIADYPPFRGITPAPPYEFDHREEKIMSVIQSLMHRHLHQDLSIFGKIIIFLIWAAAIALPWLLQMNMGFFNRLGF